MDFQSTLRTIFTSTGAEEVSRKTEMLRKNLGSLASSNQLLTTTSKANAQALDAQAKSTDRAGNAAQKAAKKQEGYFYHIAKTTVQSALINKLFMEMVDVAGQAVQQLDAINNFPKTMASMGQSTADANASMEVLRNYVGQIGANLGEATSMVTRYTGAINDVRAATAVYQGINNALIAGDSSVAERSNALIQFSQALERGKPDIREWNTLTQNMSQQLGLVAKEMGYVSSIELGESLRDGNESMANFVTTLTRLSTGTGVIAQQTMSRLNGVQFAFAVMKNTMVQGLAAVLQAVGRANIVSFFTFWTQVIQVLAQWAVIATKAIMSLLNVLLGLFGASPLKFSEDLGTSVSDVGGSLGEAADSAGDIGDGLDGASKSAKELAKSLAPFDKMNVLPDKDTGSSGGGGGGDEGGAVGGFDPSAIGELGSLMGDITGKLKEVSVWAKIVGGTLAGLAAIKFGSVLIDQIDKVAKNYAKAGKAIQATHAKIKSILTGPLDDEGNKIGGFTDKLKNIPVVIGGSFASLAKFLTNPYVLMAAAILGAIAGIKYLYDTNENFKKGFDSVWKPVIDTFKAIGEWLKVKIPEWIDALKVKFNEWMEIPAFKWIVDAIKAFGEWIGKVLDKIGLAGSWMERFGKIIAVSILVPISLLIASIVAFFALIAAAIGVVIGIAALVVIQFIRIWNVIKSTWDFIVSTWNGLTKFFSDLWDDVVKIFNDVSDKTYKIWEDAVERFGDLWSGVIDWFKGIWDGIAGFFSDIWDGVVSSVITVKDAFVDFFNTIANSVAIQIISDIFNFIVSAIRGLVEIWFAVLMLGIQIIINGIVALRDWFIELWNKIVEIFSVVGTWFSEQFQQAWDAIVAAFDGAVAWFAGVWAGIVEVFSVVATWFSEQFQKAWDGIVLIWNTVSQWFYTNVWQRIVSVFIGAVNFYRDLFQRAWDAIKTVWSVVSSWFGDVWQNIKNVFATVNTWLRDKFQNAWDMIKGVFGGVSGFFSGVWGGITNGLNSGLQLAINMIYRFMNKAGELINRVIEKFNSISGAIPGGPQIGYRVPYFAAPQLARGGIVEQATMAMIGEDGAEAVVPLENNTDWIEKLAKKINSSTGGSGQPIQLTIKIGEETIATKVIDLINEKTQMSGRNAIYV